MLQVASEFALHMELELRWPGPYVYGCSLSKCITLIIYFMVSHNAYAYSTSNKNPPVFCWVFGINRMGTLGLANDWDWDKGSLVIYHGMCLIHVNLCP